MTDIACQTCKFWRFVDTERATDADYGECRRRAPSPPLLPPITADPREPQIMGNWPLTFVGDWCGEYVVHPRKGPTFA